MPDRVSPSIAERWWRPICVPDGYPLGAHPPQVLLAIALECHQTGGVIMGSGGVKLVWYHCRHRRTQVSQTGVHKRY